MAALAAVVLLPAAPSTVSAAPPLTQAEIDAQKTQVLAELEQMKAEFPKRVDEYVEISQKIEQVQTEIDQANAAIENQDVTLEEMRSSLASRAVELYRRDKLTMIEILLGARSAIDLMNRLSFLLMTAERDQNLISDVTAAQRENFYEQKRLFDRRAELESLQQRAEDRRARIERMIEFRQKQLKLLAQTVPVSTAIPVGGSGGTFAGALPDSQFLPDNIISEGAFRNATSMSAADIQSFLSQQSGRLGSYRGTDHSGATKTAAEMIAEAAVAWNVNPKVLLVKLQKEQSLLQNPNPSTTAMDWALGVGKTDSSTIYRYRGFGNQVWWGAATLNNNANRWQPGTTLTIDGRGVTPVNAPTFSLYRYTPHIHGNTSFWMLYWRYFGSPQAA